MAELTSEYYQTWSKVRLLSLFYRTKKVEPCSDEIIHHPADIIDTPYA
jgi:hypothetical protein